jgi:hypothetical protein
MTPHQQVIAGNRFEEKPLPECRVVRQGPLVYLSRLCFRWGGELTTLPEQEFNVLNWEPGISSAPDGWHAVDIPRRRVIAAEGHACPGCVVHEMGHLFLVEAEPEIRPDEWPWFGWEIALARQAGCYQTWSKSTKTYIVGGSCEGVEWGRLKPHEKRRLVADRIAHAKAIGIVSQDGAPLRTRN